MYRNAITFQVTDTIRSYELNFHPVPHGVTISCKRYTVGFPVCYGSPSDVFALAAASYIYIHYALKKKRKEWWWWHVTLHVHTCSGHNCIIPLVRWSNTDSAPSKPVTLQRNQLLIHYVVKLQVWIHLKSRGGTHFKHCTSPLPQ